MEISVIIPVYRSSPCVPRLLKVLSSQSVKPEVIVVVDEPAEGFLSELRFMDAELKLIVNERRIGKARALNMAVANSSGDIILFLDADVELPNDPEFLAKLLEEIRDTDILDLRKVVKEGGHLLSRMAHYEYLASNAASWLLTRYVEGVPAINGAAFAIRRRVYEEVGGFSRVISEDFDFASKAYLKGFRFKYSKKLTVYGHAHASWRDWLRQRERWALGAVEWAARWGPKILSTLSRRPQAWLLAILILLPSLIAVLSGMLLASLMTVEIQTELSIGADASLIGGALAALSGFLATLILYWILGKSLGFRVRILELALYYFVYSPLYLIMIIEAILMYMLGERNAPDWVV